MTFFRRFPNKCLHFPKNSIYLPKFSDDLFLVIHLFRVLVWSFSIWGGQIRSRHRRYGGSNSLLFNKITILPLLFLSRRGGKLHCQFRWGAMAGFAPPGSATAGTL